MAGSEMIDRFEEQLRGMIGQVCWSVQVSGVGSLANLHFGEKRKRRHAMLHPDFNLSMDERAYQGSFVLYLEECPWRLDGPDSVLATWMDSHEQTGRIAMNLPHMKGSVVRSAEVSRPGLDLVLGMDSGLTLRIFPDQIDPDQGDNYSVTIVDETYIIAANSTLYLE